MRLAIITDVHYSSRELRTCGIRETGAGAQLFEKAVACLNGECRPDVTLLCGDMVNRGDEDYGKDDLARMSRIAARLESRVIAIPGNHDGGVERFYEYFPRPDKLMTLGKVRFIVNYDDEECPGYNARRNEAGIALLREARREFSGALISLQHVPCIPEGRVQCRYNYVNHEEINRAEEEAGVLASLSGHHHEGFEPFRLNGVTYCAVAALCQPPFPFMLVDLVGEDELRFEMRSIT